MRHLLYVSTLVILGSSSAIAQTCLGAPSFATGAWRGGAAITLNDGGNEYGVEAAAGKSAGLFGGLALGRIDLDGVSAGITTLGTHTGYSLPIGKRARICPLASIKYMHGPNVTDGADELRTRGRTLGIGAGIGTTLPITASVDLAPFATAAYTHTRITFRSNTLIGSGAVSNDVGVLGLGLGVTVHKVFSIRPSVSVPMRKEGNNATVMLAFGMNFGRRR